MLSALCGHLLCDISHRQMYEEVSYLNMLGLAGFQMGENFGYLNANAMDNYVTAIIKGAGTPEVMTPPLTPTLN